LALARIRDLKLYRAQFSRFCDYCREKWNYGHSKVYYLISAAEVASHLSTVENTPTPDHESQVRPLLGLSPKQSVNVWRRAAKLANGAKITAKMVRSALGRFAYGHPMCEEVRPPRQPTENCWRIWKLVNELEILLTRNASRDQLLEKLAELESDVASLMLPKNIRNSRGSCNRSVADLHEEAMDNLAETARFA
jgi:hypothetical protein